MNKKEAYGVLSKLCKVNLPFILTSIWFWAGKYARALDYINTVYDENCAVLDVYCWRGILYYFSNDHNYAIDNLEKAERANPKKLEIKYLLAEIYFESAHIKKAQIRYRALLGNSDYKTFGLYGIGNCLLKTNHHVEALGFFNKALSYAKLEYIPKILNKKGLCLMELNKIEEAIRCFEECVRFVPTDYSVQLNLALALGKSKKYKEAAVVYKNIIKKMPHNLIVINNFASCLAACHDYNEALNYCNKGLKIDPGNPDLLINKGYCLYKLGRYNNSLECLNEAEKILKDDIILTNNKALCLMALEKYDDALKLFDSLLKSNNSDDLMLNKAYCLVKKGMYSEALIYLLKIKDERIKNFDYFTLKGICFEHLGNHEAAVENYNKSLNMAR
ncbi:MAG: tetratricopeptide repeat protein [Tepidanaerobacteraceae bacterium]